MINETIGWIGNILFAICGIPQVIKTYRSKSVKDLSLLFLWLWFEGLPITSLELYHLLKDNGVLVVSGHYFFPGLKDTWRHKDECIRVTYSQSDEEMQRGLSIIAEVVRGVYAKHCGKNK